ncbi:hypothetical protein GW879_00520, partial [Candidatus Kaiserbacteria bacterium]|nr:hypothetical protein [Candidatus Kaiserbacteria bacterium]
MPKNKTAKTNGPIRGIKNSICTVSVPIKMVRVLTSYRFNHIFAINPPTSTFIKGMVITNPKRKTNNPIKPTNNPKILTSRILTAIGVIKMVAKTSKILRLKDFTLLVVN